MAELIEMVEILKAEDEILKSFTYLGVELNCENKVAKVQKRIMACNRAYFANLKLLVIPVITNKNKIVTFLAKTWTLCISTMNDLRIFERKMLRKISGPILDEENGELENKTRKYMSSMVLVT